MRLLREPAWLAVAIHIATQVCLSCCPLGHPAIHGQDTSTGSIPANRLRSAELRRGRGYDGSLKYSILTDCADPLGEEYHVSDSTTIATIATVK